MPSSRRGTGADAVSSMAESRMASDLFAWFLNVSTSVMIVFVNKVLMDNSWGYRFTFGEMAPSALTTRQPSASSLGSDLEPCTPHTPTTSFVSSSETVVHSTERSKGSLVESEQESGLLPLYLACTLFNIKPISQYTADVNNSNNDSTEACFVLLLGVRSTNLSSTTFTRLAYILSV